MYLTDVFGNGTDTVQWKSSPNERGTFDILSSCLLTLLLCVWSAVHLNVPAPKGYWTTILERIAVVNFAMGAPEFVAFMAWKEREDALNLKQKVNFHLGFADSPYRKTGRSLNIARSTYSHEKSKDNEDDEIAMPQSQSPASTQSNHASTRSKWTLRHGFYALMGGYAIKPNLIEQSKRFLPETEARHFFPHMVDLHSWDADPKGSVREFANALLDELPDVSVDDIWAKSKANRAAKTITCIQAVWFIAQCIGRLVLHMPISLLELNTFGHALCALLIYLFWWNKPFDVEIATPIFSHKACILLATWYFYTQETPIIKDLKEKGFSYNRERDLVECTNERAESPEPVPQSLVLKPGETLPGTGWALKTKISSSEKVHSLELNSRDVKRWQMAWEFCQFTAWDFGHFRFHDPVSNVWHYDREPVRDKVGLCLNSEVVDAFCIGGMCHFSGKGFSLALVSFVYGGFHVLAWFAHFRTPVEALLWRISASIVMGGALVIQLADIVQYLVGSPKLKMAWIVLCLVIGWAYMWARAYLVVECFMNLANLPSGVYALPEWSAYFPHFS